MAQKKWEEIQKKAERAGKSPGKAGEKVEIAKNKWKEIQKKAEKKQEKSKTRLAKMRKLAEKVEEKAKNGRKIQDENQEEKILANEEKAQGQAWRKGGS